MGITPQEVAGRKAFLQFDDEDTERLKAMGPLAHQYADGVIEAFYEHILAFEESRSFFPNPQTIERVKGLQKEYFLGLTSGTYGVAYVNNRISIGAIHERIGLPTKLYMAAYNFYLREVAARLFEASKRDPQETVASFLSLLKLVFFDMTLAIDTYMGSRERTIQSQAQAIREIANPVLQVREGLVILPLIGLIDTQRAREMTEKLLASIREYRAKVIILDITGVPGVDSKVANHLLQTVEAARLMGATTLVTGISSEIAQTIVTLGVDLGAMRTMTDLRSAIEEAERLLGYRVVRGGSDT